MAAQPTRTASSLSGPRGAAGGEEDLHGGTESPQGSPGEVRDGLGGGQSSGDGASGWGCGVGDPRSDAAKQWHLGRARRSGKNNTGMCTTRGDLNGKKRKEEGKETRISIACWTQWTALCAGLH